MLLLSGLLGYFYFDKKFSPEENYLSVSNESGKISLIWADENKNALLLPIHFSGDSQTYFMQFDTGAPSTVFYKNAIKNIRQIKKNNKTASGNFTIGTTGVKSSNFKIIDYGIDEKNKTDAIIGTIGTDILDGRKTVVNFRDNFIEFNLTETPLYFKNHTADFNFKKRKINFPSKLDGEREKFLWDSGTSGYELLTNKENWEKLKSPNAKTIVEKGNSWGKILTVYTAPSQKNIDFGTVKLPLNSVTYVEGFSKTQYYLMKFSGMSGMLGNKIFLNKEIYLDCKQEKFGIR